MCELSWSHLLSVPATFQNLTPFHKIQSVHKIVGQRVRIETNITHLMIVYRFVVKNNKLILTIHFIPLVHNSQRRSHHTLTSAFSGFALALPLLQRKD
jgi:hypothetical protein